MCDGGDCRCEVSLQSYLPSNVELGLRNAHCWGFLGDFSVGGRDLLTFWSCIIKLHLDRILCESMNEIGSVTSEITFLIRKKKYRL